MIEVTAPADRDVRLATPSSVVRVNRGQTRRIPTFFAAEAAQQGCAIIPADANTKAALENEVPPNVRQEAVLSAVRELLAKGDPADFTESGRPRKPSVQALVGGFEVATGEIGAAFEQALTEREGEPEGQTELDVND